MARLRMMRAPQKYVQGRDALFKFHEEMKELGDKWLFICSKSGHKMCHDKIEKSFDKKMTLMFVIFSLTSGVFAFLGAMIAIILFG